MYAITSARFSACIYVCICGACMHTGQRSVSYSEGPGFKSRPEDCYLDRFFVVFFSPLRQIP
jgi:hypothetical protein